MRKVMLALVAGCMSAAVAGAYAAQGSPAETDKAGRAGPGTSAGEMGAAKPTPSTPGAGAGAASKSGAGTGAAAGTGAGTSGGASSSTGAGSSAASTTGGGSATVGSGMDDTDKSRRSRRARASKG